jgi:hypothetical protein
MTNLASECGRYCGYFLKWLNRLNNLPSLAAPCLAVSGTLNRKPASDDDWMSAKSNQRRGDMSIDRALVFSILISAISAFSTGPALAQACTRQGIDVSCDDGRRGILSGQAIIWADGTRSSLASPHPSVIIGNKSSVVVGQGVFVGQGKGVVPLDNPSAPDKARCPILDGVAYCY